MALVQMAELARTLAVFAVFLNGPDVYVLNISDDWKEPIEICPEQKRYPLEIPREHGEKLVGSKYFVVGYLEREREGKTIYLSADLRGKKLPNVEHVRKVVDEIGEFISKSNYSTLRGVGERPGNPLVRWFNRLCALFRRPHSDGERFDAMFRELRLNSGTVDDKDKRIDIRKPVSPNYELLVYSRTLDSKAAVGLSGFAIYNLPPDDALEAPGRETISSAPIVLDASYSKVNRAQEEAGVVKVQIGYKWGGGGGTTCYNPPCPVP